MESHIINGTDRAEKILTRLRDWQDEGATPPAIASIVVGNDPVSLRYLAMKKKIAARAAIHLEIHTLPAQATTDDVCHEIDLIMKTTRPINPYTGILIQLPLPSHIDKHAVCNYIPASHDIDVLSEAGYQAFLDGSPVMPPVVGACHELVKAYHIPIFEKKIAVMGYGALVGKPVSDWLTMRGVQHTVFKDAASWSHQGLHDYNMIISGTGASHSIRKHHVQKGVILFDAGTSEVGGQLHGDCHPEVYEHASLVTPVPGGIGPMTLAVLCRNAYLVCGGGNIQ
jgi:methylenetetrahydrofolate dehydrogenase (NADP+) / methenyltetrahydrofolate cyclohydrolase